jgi:uncharacterized protein involved in response to NO
MQVALDVALFIVAIMAGRVIPMFTNNGVPGAAASRRVWLERSALGLVLALVAVDLFQLTGPAVVVLASAACAAHAWRWALWQPWRVRRVPMVWVLHLAYLWVPLHFALRALAELSLVPASAGIHALTVGAVGGLVIGMMTRTARGHTGRPLRADRFDIACYVLVLLAGVVRVALPLLVPGGMLQAVMVSAFLWSAGFALYALRYWGFLTRPRLDGLAG